jgi:hypothetical protein
VCFLTAEGHCDVGQVYDGRALQIKGCILCHIS